MSDDAIHLHIGLPKTGTTYLQSLLWSHRDELLEAGLLLPGFGPREHLWASGGVREEPRLERRHADAPGAWARLAGELAGWSGRGLITHEFLCGAAADQVGRALQPLAGREVHVVVTAREIVSLVTARWQEWVKNGATGDVDHYPPGEQYRPADEWGWGTLDLAAVLERWSAHVPPDRIHVVCPPEPDSRRDELWRRFAGVLGLDDVVTDAVVADEGGRANESLGIVQVELLRRVNAELATSGEFRRAVDRGVWIRGYLAQEQLLRLGDERFWPSQERVEQLRRRGEAGLDRVAAGGYDVVGSLDELRTPDALPPRRHPSEVTDAELMPAAARLVVGLLTDVRAARAEARDLAAVADGTRGASRGALRGRGRAAGRFWQGGPRRGTAPTDG